MSALPNYARMPGPGDFSPPDDPAEHDATDIRELLARSPKFVEESLGEAVNWRAVALAWIDGDAIEVSRLLGDTVQKAIDADVASAIRRYDEDPRNNRHNPDGEIHPWGKLEREYSEHLRRTPRPNVPEPLDMRALANRLLGGVRP